jgi:glycosyltransferase involved in cell wall biosynthesis
LPSHLRSEAYGIVLVEAARAGRAMISCEIGTGTSFVNRHGETGLVVAPADVRALGDAMRNLWEDGGAAARFGAAARLHYEHSLTAHAMTREYLMLYERLLNSRRSQLDQHDIGRKNVSDAS